MRNYFTFGLIDSRDYGVYISGSGAYNAPRRVYTEVTVPGRNGTLLIDNGNFENIPVTYPAFIAGGSNFSKRMADLRSALLSQIGYSRLYDSYNDNQFREACFMNEINVNPSSFLTSGKFDIVFNCKPQRFLFNGQATITITEDATPITCPTPFPCKPLLTVTGYGELEVANGADSTILTIGNIYPKIIIDCETCEAYLPGGGNANDAITVPENGKFPFVQGNNLPTYFVFDDTITQIEVVPRWFIL